MPETSRALTSVIGNYPYRMAFAGGWIDQPFISELNPDPFGSMVVVAIHPNMRFMDRCGMGTSTRKIAEKLWGTAGLPANRDPAALVEELYAAENEGKDEPSGSQDMIGMIYPGVNRLDYSINHASGVFPVHIESNSDSSVARWLEDVIYMVPVIQRPWGYNPLGIKNLDPEWVRRLGQSGKDCYDAIVACDRTALGESMNEAMRCWEALLPHVVRHDTIKMDLMALLSYYQERYDGAMFSGCGGGYFYVVSDEPVPGGFKVSVRT